MEESLLTKAGYRLTKPRRLVLAALRSCHGPASARGLYKQLKGAVNLVSVYRSLHLFELLGVAFYEGRDEEKVYYLAQQAHHHIVCRQCGYSECIPCNHDFPARWEGFSSLTHRLQVSGVCHACSRA